MGQFITERSGVVTSYLDDGHLQQQVICTEKIRTSLNTWPDKTAAEWAFNCGLVTWDKGSPSEPSYAEELADSSQDEDLVDPLPVVRPSPLVEGTPVGPPPFPRFPADLYSRKR
jgi:hypothetical protein